MGVLPRLGFVTMERKSTTCNPEYKLRLVFQFKHSAHHTHSRSRTQSLLPNFFLSLKIACSINVILSFPKYMSLLPT